MKIHYLTLTPRSRSHKMLPRNPRLFVTYAPAKCDVATSRRRCIYKKISFDLDLGVKVTQNVAQYPQHHVSYAPAKFDIATSHG